MSQGSISRINEAGRRYASALFDLAKDNNAIDAVQTDLTKLAEVMDQSTDLQSALSTPLYSAEDKMAVLVAIGEKLKLSNLVIDFLKMTAHNRRSGNIKDMIHAYSDLCAAHNGVQYATAYVAHTLDAKQKNKLEQLVGEYTDGKVELDIIEEPDLIGGIQLQIGSKLIDASIRAKLTGLNLAMKGA